jgi:hypothetical protein
MFCRAPRHSDDTAPVEHPPAQRPPVGPQVQPPRVRRVVRGGPFTEAKELVVGLRA